MGLVMHHAHTPPETLVANGTADSRGTRRSGHDVSSRRTPPIARRRARELVRRLDSVPLTSVWSEQRAREWWEQASARVPGVIADS